MLLIYPTYRYFQIHVIAGHTIYALNIYALNLDLHYI